MVTHERRRRKAIEIIFVELLINQRVYRVNALMFHNQRTEISAAESSPLAFKASDIHISKKGWQLKKDCCKRCPVSPIGPKRIGPRR